MSHPPTRKDPLVWMSGAVFLLAVAVPGGMELGSGILRISLVMLAGVLYLGHLAPPGTRPPDRMSGGWALAGILLAAAGLRVIGLNGPLWFDEMVMVVDSIRHPFSSLWLTFPTDNHHPLYSILAWLAVGLFGEHAWVLRLPALLFGVGSVWAVHLFARRRLGAPVALLGAALLAVSYHHLWFTQNARGYTTLLFFSLLSSHLLLDAIETGRRKSWVGYGVTLGLGMFTHLTCIFVVAGHVAVLLGTAVRQRADARPATWTTGALGLMLAGAVTLSLHALMLPQMIRFFLLRPDRVAVQAEWTNPLWAAGEAIRSLGIGLIPGLIAGLGALTLAVAGTRRAWSRCPGLPTLLFVPALVTAATLLALGRNLWPRMFFGLAGFAVLVFVLGIFAVTERLAAGRGKRRRVQLAGAAAALLVLGSGVLLTRAWRRPKQDYDGARAWIESARRPEDTVVTVGLAGLPYSRFWKTDYVFVESIAEFRNALPEGSPGYVISSFPIFLRSRHPELFELVGERGVEAARFPGSVGGGDVVVFRVAK